MTAQRQRKAQDCYAVLGTKVPWLTEIHYAAGNWDRKHRVIANINNDLTTEKGPIADIESLNSHFRNVLKTDSGRFWAKSWSTFLEPGRAFRLLVTEQGLIERSRTVSAIQCVDLK